jgi:hypothetical protein
LRLSISAWIHVSMDTGGEYTPAIRISSGASGDHLRLKG